MDSFNESVWPTLEDSLDKVENLAEQAILMDFDELLEKNSISDLNFEQELDKNYDVFEQLIFGNDEMGGNNKDYSILDQLTSKKVLEAVEKTEGLIFFFQRLL